MAKKVEQWLSDLQKSHRLTLAQAITLLESEREEDQKTSDLLLLEISKKKKSKTLRIGISGAPGAGKSSLIERIGLDFISRGHRVAVLAIDPSSEITKGSVLGDKTRMEELSVKEEAFIRPSPSRGHLGGVSVATHDSISVCEFAGYDIVLVETVGIGQSESQAADLVDLFCLVVQPGAGDELQGIKRGVLEKVDCVLVNKCDGENKIAAQVAQKQLSSSLKILRHQEIPTYLTSAMYNQGISDFIDFAKEFMNRNEIEKRRSEQEARWITHYFYQFLRLKVQSELDQSAELVNYEKQVEQGQMTARDAARKVFEKFPWTKS